MALTVIVMVLLPRLDVAAGAAPATGLDVSE